MRAHHLYPCDAGYGTVWSGATVSSGSPSRRDPRIDVLRGFALLMIFIDHLPGNVLGFATLHMFGFSDAAELFVILAGCSSMIAYGRSFERDGVRVGLARVFQRCLRLYLFQVGLLVAVFVMVKEWGRYYNILIPDLIPFLSFGTEVVKHGAALKALPAKIDILPLYMCLLALFPLIYWGMRRSMAATVAVSAAIWAVANFDHDLNLHNWMDGHGWFFNPFAWQFLFVLGAAGARLIAARGGSLPRIGWLVGLCWAYVLFALLVSAPWVSWHLWDFRPIPIPTPDKSSMDPLRLLHVLALMYLALSAPRFLAVTRSRWLAGVDVCGRHSLEIFSLATVLAMFGGLLLTTFGGGLAMQAVVNVAGLGLMIVVAQRLEANKVRARGKMGEPSRAPPQLSQSHGAETLAQAE